MTWPISEHDRQVLANAGLTDKERQVVDLQNRGLSQRTIAFALGISRSAVQSRLETAARRIALSKGRVA